VIEGFLLGVRSTPFWDVTLLRFVLSDVTGQLVSPVFKIKQSKRALTLEGGTHRHPLIVNQ